MENVNILTMLFGIVIIVFRLPGLIWPDKVLPLHRKCVNMSPTGSKTVAVLLFIISLMIFITILRAFKAVAILAILFGLCIFIVGVVFLFLDEIRPAMNKLLDKISPLVYRILCGVATAIGVALVIIGLIARS